MSTYGAAQAAAPSYEAAEHVVVPPSAFSDAWEARPQVEVCIGLRRIPFEDWQVARAQAARVAVAAMSNDADEIIDRVSYVEAFNDAVMKYAVARGTCDVNDRRLPYFEVAEDTVPRAFTARGLRLVWDALERFHVTSTLLVSPIADEDAVKLARLLARKGALAKLPARRAATVRKLLGYVLAEIAEVDDDLFADLGQAVE